MITRNDLDRLEELKLKVFKLIAIRRLNKIKDPDILAATQIERHGGRVKKAIRLLREAGIISPYKYALSYKVLTFDRDSRTYEKFPKFRTKWTEFFEEVTHQINYDYIQKNFKIGYVCLKSLEPQETIYVYYHKEDFDVYYHKEDFDVYYHREDFDTKDTYVYPKEYRQERCRQILKSLVEYKFQDKFQDKLTKYLGLPEDSFKKEPRTLIYFNQFSYKAYDFTEENYLDFLKEYNHFKDYFEAMISQINKTFKIINSKGGHTEIIKEMRKTTIAEIIEEIPLFIKKHIYLYVASNVRFMDYDYLYSDDESITNVQYGDTIKHTNFDPQEDELKVIQDYKKEQANCTKKNISELYTNTLKNV